MNLLHVVFDLLISPAIEVGLTPETTGQEARKMLALFLYEHNRISIGKACELGRMSYWEFAERNRELGITIPYSDKDLQADLGRLELRTVAIEAAISYSSDCFSIYNYRKSDQ